MKQTSKQLAVLLAALLLLSPLGCSEKEEAPQEDQGDAIPATAETPVDLEDVISSWEAGNTEQATAQFARVDWEHPDVLANVPALNLSQQDFMTSSKDQQAQFMQDVKSLATTLRKLGLHILSTADTASASGDTATAKEYYEALSRCGHSLDSDDYYELIQLTAKNLSKAAEDRLQQLRAEP
jgi:hypothetical protein